jgi:AbrB family looped-hinge helix DNA binding protein
VKREHKIAGAVINPRGQVTIPVGIRTALGLKTGDRVEFVELGKGRFMVVAKNRSVRELEGLFRKKARKPVAIGQMNVAIVRRTRILHIKG